MNVAQRVRGLALLSLCAVGTASAADVSGNRHSAEASATKVIALTQLSQLEEKAEKNQRRLPEGLHYIEWVARRTGICGAVMRGGGWSGRLSLSWWARSL